MKWPLGMPKLQEAPDLGSKPLITSMCEKHAGQDSCFRHYVEWEKRERKKIYHTVELNDSLSFKIPIVLP